MRSGGRGSARLVRDLSEVLSVLRHSRQIEEAGASAGLYGRPLHAFLDLREREPAGIHGSHDGTDTATNDVVDGYLVLFECLKYSDVREAFGSTGAQS